MSMAVSDRVVPIDDSIVFRRQSEISTIANVFVDSQDDIRLILLLMYKTIIIIIIRWPIIIGLSNSPSISPLGRTSHTRKLGFVQIRTRPNPRTVRVSYLSSSRRLTDSRTPRPRAGNLRSCGRSVRVNWWVFVKCEPKSSQLKEPKTQGESHFSVLPLPLRLTPSPCPSKPSGKRQG